MQPLRRKQCNTIDSNLAFRLQITMAYGVTSAARYRFRDNGPELIDLTGNDTGHADTVYTSSTYGRHVCLVINNRCPLVPQLWMLLFECASITSLSSSFFDNETQQLVA